MCLHCWKTSAYSIHKVRLFSAFNDSRIPLILVRSLSLGLDLKSKAWLSAYLRMVTLNNSLIWKLLTEYLGFCCLAVLGANYFCLSSWLKLSHSLHSLAEKHLKTNWRSPLNNSISLWCSQFLFRVSLDILWCVKYATHWKEKGRKVADMVAKSSQNDYLFCQIQIIWTLRIMQGTG